MFALLAATALLQVTVACGSSNERSPAGTKTAARGSGENYDLDDNTVRHYGRPAGKSDVGAITAVVESYYAAAARGHGAAACALTSHTLAETMPYDYEQELGRTIPPGGVPYLRGATSCVAVLSLLFSHLHSELTAPVSVTAIRLTGSYGYALVDSTTLPASMIEVAREGDAWRIDELLGRPLP